MLPKINQVLAYYFNRSCMTQMGVYSAADASDSSSDSNPKSHSASESHSKIRYPDEKVLPEILKSQLNTESAI